MHRPLPPISYLKRRLRVDRTTGNLYWRPRPSTDFPAPRFAATWNRRFAGKVAGTDRGNGYRVVIIDSQRYYEHRIVFALVRKVDPGTLTVDHRSATKCNRPARLRVASQQENCMHKRRLSTNNTSGVLGVWWHAGAKRWSAQLKFYGEKIHLGHYTGIREAAAARRAAEAFFFGEFKPSIDSLSHKGEQLWA